MANDMLHDFGSNKSEHLKRSTWLFPIETKTAVKQGALVPLGYYYNIPGEVASDEVESLVRLALTPYKPFMGNMYFTYGAYFVPFRVLLKKFPEMFGNGKPSEWSSPTEYIVPQTQFAIGRGSLDTATAGVGYDSVVNTSIAAVNTGVVISKPGNLADYLGLPPTVYDETGSLWINVLPFLSYERIWTDYWRDENYQNPDPDLEKCYDMASGETNFINCRFCLHYANKFHDYFTSLLPNTQKGAGVAATYPLDTLWSGNNPIMTKFTSNETGQYAAIFGNKNGVATNGSLTSSSVSGVTGVVGLTSSAGTISNQLGSTNLGINISITELRNAFALQRAAERNARTGSRAMNEAMRGIFEANAPAILDKAEFLGGNTIKLNLVSVPQTNDTPGSLGAFSATGSNTKSFAKTLDEPGIVMYVGSVRIKHSYPFGIDRFWKKVRRYDFYDPALAHISEQPVYAYQLQALTAASAYNESVIGFNEAWVEYEKPVSLITGYLRGTDHDLRSWVLQDRRFTGGDEVVSPYQWYAEDGNEVAEICRDYNTNYDSYQFIIDFKAIIKRTACKPLHSIPGFIDHLIA
ncbi:major capsid protein [Capybara microvirus Cap3_SP_550]|nr:major capsid protein [Capybara microvirus Cap3_SP_550]